MGSFYSTDELFMQVSWACKKRGRTLTSWSSSNRNWTACQIRNQSWANLKALSFCTSAYATSRTFRELFRCSVNIQTSVILGFFLGNASLCQRLSTERLVSFSKKITLTLEWFKKKKVQKLWSFNCKYSSSDIWKSDETLFAKQNVCIVFSNPTVHTTK